MCLELIEEEGEVEKELVFTVIGKFTVLLLLIIVAISPAQFLSLSNPSQLKSQTPSVKSQSGKLNLKIPHTLSLSFSIFASDLKANKNYSAIPICNLSLERERRKKRKSSLKKRKESGIWQIRCLM